MSWFTTDDLSITNGSSIATVGTEDIKNIKTRDALVVAGFAPVEIKDAYIDGGGNSTIELDEPWAGATQSSVLALVMPTAGNFSEAVDALNKATTLMYDNFDAYKDWYTNQAGTATFTNPDGSTFTYDTLAVLISDLNQLKADIDVKEPVANLSNYDNELEGFIFLATDTSKVYIKNSNTSGDWTDPIPWGIGDTGPQGDPLTWDDLTQPQKDSLKGDTGEQGLQGAGLPTGGTANQVLSKIDNTDYNYQWNDPIYDISAVSGLQAALDGKVDDAQVLKNVPANALFTDTTYTVQDGGLTAKNFTQALYDKLILIEDNANDYQHPATHDPSIIAETTSKSFVSDAERTAWNSKASGSHSHGISAVIGLQDALDDAAGGAVWIHKLNSFTAVSNEYNTVYCASDVTITLPTIVAGDSFYFKNILTSTGKLIIDNPSYTIRGSTTIAAGTDVELSAAEYVSLVAIDANNLEVVNYGTGRGLKTDTQTSFLAAGTTTYTVPANCYEVLITATAGGGRSTSGDDVGSSDTHAGSGSGGGGGATVDQYSYPVVPGTVLSVTHAGGDESPIVFDALTLEKGGNGTIDPGANIPGDGGRVLLSGAPQAASSTVIPGGAGGAGVYRYDNADRDTLYNAGEDVGIYTGGLGGGSTYSGTASNYYHGGGGGGASAVSNGENGITGGYNVSRPSGFTTAPSGGIGSGGGGGAGVTTGSGYYAQYGGPSSTHIRIDAIIT